MVATFQDQGRLARAIRALHDDEDGLNTIEMVLIVCAAATLLAVAFKYLWGTNNAGIIAVMITTTIKNFTGVFTGNSSGGS